jgi:glycosyltransferase involved in cell wall biosynthesis
LHLNDRVKIISALPPADLVTVMNAIDALVLPSRSVRTWKEQFGRVIIEAHACATPVIGSGSGAIPEVVGVGGLIFPEGDSASLSACIIRLLNDPDLRRKLGAIGQRRVHEHYTWQKVAERMYDIYQTVGQISRPELAENRARHGFPAEGPS